MRVKYSPRRERRKKLKKLTKGYFGSKHKLYRTMKIQVMKSLMYAYRDRKQRKRITRLYLPLLVPRHSRNQNNFYI
ncbi:MAG TPA: 50S ribosomal protein L20, partial [Aquificae bacterium]|nr:50S ribosomal protein L20 [Aquificota bacterium]